MILRVLSVTVGFVNLMQLRLTLRDCLDLLSLCECLWRAVLIVFVEMERATVGSIIPWVCIL